MNIQEIREMLDSTINSNGKREISGQSLNAALNAILDYIEEHTLGGGSSDGDVEQSPARVDLSGVWSQRWGIGALESLGPDNWGTDTVVTAVEDSDTESYQMNPIFGSLGYTDTTALIKVSENLYKLPAGGHHNLMGPITHDVYFKYEDAKGIVLTAYADASCVDTKVILNDYSYVTDYKLTKES